MPAGKDKESGFSPEIARLSALLARDPNSKLFMPLAEEYMKAGMAEEAVSTLEDGLKANPSYMSARVLLGKAYIEKNDLEGARVQFEQVVKAVPDNLLAHRKLGEIYRTLGNREGAIRSYRMITLLSPKDEEAKRCLADLESGAVFQAPAAPEQEGPPPEKPILESHRAQAPAPEAPPAPMQADDAPSFDISGFDEPEEALEEEALTITLDEPEPAPVEPVFEAAEPAEAAIFGPAEEAAEEGPPVYSIEETPSEDEGMDWLQPQTPDQPAETGAGPVKGGYAVDLSRAEGLEDIFGSYQAGAPEEAETTEDVYEINDISGTGIKTGPIPEVPAAFAEGPGSAGAFDADFEQVEEKKEEAFETETLAELYVAQGFYDRAIKIYKNLLLLEPDNVKLKQKLEELYQLERLTKSGIDWPDTRPEVPEIHDVEPEPLPAEIGAFEQDEGAGIVWEAEAEAIPEPFEGPAAEQAFGTAGLEADYSGHGPRDLAPGTAGKSYGPEAVSRLERFLENIRRKVKR